MTEHTFWHDEIRPGEGPLIAIAPHAGSELDDALVPFLSDAALRDHWQMHATWTAPMTAMAPTRLWATRSRLEVDLDEARADSAGRRRLRGARSIELWRELPPRELVERGLRAWDAFHDHLGRILDATATLHGRFVAVVLRAQQVGLENAPGFAHDSPELVVQTGSVDWQAHGAMLERFVDVLADGVVLGYPLGVVEDAESDGGHLARWINERYGERGCALGLELHTVVVDEASGLPERWAHAQVTDHIRQSLRAAMDCIAPAPLALPTPTVPRVGAHRM